MHLLKTVIGSFPPLNAPVEDVIRAYLDLQLKYGVDIVSDGEPRADMIQYFYQIPGLGRISKGLYVKERIKPMDDSSDFVKVKDLKHLYFLIKRLGRNDIRVKTTITGPLTLGFFSATRGVKYYDGILDLRLYQDLADALKPLVLELLSRGSMVQVDEPGLSQRVLEVGKAVKLVNLMLEGIPEHFLSEGLVSAHICGALTDNIFKSLLNLNVSTLSLAFSSRMEEGNIQILSKEWVERLGKRIGVGCIPVQVMNVTEVDSILTIIKRIQTITEKIGYENIAYIHPDCGLRNTPQPVAEKILEKLDKASKGVAKMVKEQA